MINRDPKCVHVDDNLGRARLVAGWLTSLGIPAEVMDENTLGGFVGLVSILPDKLGFRGVEVWVNDPTQADRAREVLAQQAAEIEAKANRTGTLETACEECGKKGTFPVAQQGTIQNCPHCGKMIDVPDPDEEWDVGEPEGGAEA
jgi:Putative prokaryotic signal transducing protein